MNLTAEPPRSKMSGTLRLHTRFENPTEGRHNCSMDVNEQLLSLEDGKQLSLVVGESEKSYSTGGDCVMMEEVTNVDKLVEKESDSEEHYEIPNNSGPGKNMERLTNAPDPELNQSGRRENKNTVWK